MSSMTETMTTTRKVMWRFESTGLAVSQGIPFYLSVGWEEKGVCPPDLDWSPSGVLPMLGDHIWFLNQLSPFFSLPRPDNGTYLGLDGDRDSCLLDILGSEP